MTAAPSHRAFVGLGSNLEDPAAQVRSGIADLAALAHIRVVRHSIVYRSKPVGYEEQPDFANAVAELETRLAPRPLLRELLHIEQRHGRVRSIRNGPRTLDCDLLLHDDCIMTGPELILPHPRMHERAFVLVPLHDLAPELEIPGRGRVASLLARVDASEVVPWERA
jgi:2-amino-4-hydroxy-6-hydroxymethyldihydropteridine diphosphokinase